MRGLFGAGFGFGEVGLGRRVEWVVRFLGRVRLGFFVSFGSAIWVRAPFFLVYQWVLHSILHINQFSFYIPNPSSPQQSKPKNASNHSAPIPHSAYPTNSSTSNSPPSTCQLPEECQHFPSNPPSPTHSHSHPCHHLSPSTGYSKLSTILSLLLYLLNFSIIMIWGDCGIRGLFTSFVFGGFIIIGPGGFRGGLFFISRFCGVGVEVEVEVEVWEFIEGAFGRVVVRVLVGIIGIFFWCWALVILALRVLMERSEANQYIFCWFFLLISHFQPSSQNYPHTSALFLPNSPPSSPQPIFSDFHFHFHSHYHSLSQNQPHQISPNSYFPLASPPAYHSVNLSN